MKTYHVTFLILCLLTIAFMSCEKKEFKRIVGKWESASSSKIEFLKDGTFKVDLQQVIGPGQNVESFTIERNGKDEIHEITSSWEGVYANIVISKSMVGSYKFIDTNTLRVYVPLIAIPAHIEGSTMALLFEASLEGDRLNVKGKSLKMQDEEYYKIK